jgi:hypothetical protein
MKNAIDPILLEALSFYTPMTKEQLILDLDSKKIRAIPELNLELLEKRLNYFVKKKKFKIMVTEGEKTYIKLYPKKRGTFYRILKFYSIGQIKKMLKRLRL